MYISTSEVMQRERFLYNLKDLNISSKTSDCKGIRSLVSDDECLHSWKSEKNECYQETVPSIFDCIHSNYMVSDKPLQDSSDGNHEESYVNRLRRESATVWCEHGAQLPINVKMGKPKNSFGVKKGFAIKSFVFPHASIAPFARPMAQHARSTNEAAPQHTMLIPRLSATETYLDEDHDDAAAYSNVSVDQYYPIEKRFRNVQESVNHLESDTRCNDSPGDSIFRSASAKSYTGSSHYSHLGFPSSSPVASKNSIFSKHCNECTDNTLHTSPLSSQHPLYTHLNNSSYSIDNLYPIEPARKLYIVNLAKDDILSDNET